MKKMKKLFAMLIAMVMVLGMSMSVFAAAPTSGSITVNPNYKGQTYTLYKLFDAKMTYAEDGTLKAVTYQVPEGKTLPEDNKWFELNDNGNVVAKAGVADDWAKDAEAIAWAKSFGTQVGSEITAASDNDANVKWDELGWGYYFVTSSLGSFIGIDTDNPDVTIKDKNTPPSIDKSITGVAGEDVAFVATATEETTDTGTGAKEQAIAQIGDTVSYKLVVNVQPGGYNYVITDTLTNLKIKADSFKVGGAAIAENEKVDATGTTITDEASTFTIKLSQTYLDSLKEATDLEITYDAVLDTSAAVADEANPNTVKLTYGTSPDNKSEDQAKVWTAKVNVEKKAETETGDPLPGAGFKLKNSEGKFYKWDATTGVTWVEEAQADEIFTGADGMLTQEFKGLKTGAYTLVESTVPDGYNKHDDTTVTITNEDVTAENLAQTKIVVNKAGAVLPSTGGMGTTIFYALGAVLVIGAGVILATRRRKAQ